MLLFACEFRVSIKMISNPFEVAKKCLEKCTCGSGSDLAQVQVTLDKKAQFLADNFVELRQKRVVCIFI